MKLISVTSNGNRIARVVKWPGGYSCHRKELGYTPAEGLLIQKCSTLYTKRKKFALMYAEQWLEGAQV